MIGEVIRLATYTYDGKRSYGVAREDGLIDLARRLPYPSWLEVLRNGALQEATAAASAVDEADHPLEGVSFDLPIMGDNKILCVGINYPKREEEYRGASSAGSYPNLFPRFASSFVGHNHPIVRPFVSDQFDYEGEVALVIGRECRHAGADEAIESIVGVTIANEGTVRDWVRHGTLNVTQGKNFDQSGSMGPWVATGDIVDPSSPLSISTRVNGEVRQNDSTARLHWGFADLICYISQFLTLTPGDVLLTGTPTGAGGHHDPPLYLSAGDVVEVEVGGVGTLKNRVVDEERSS